MAEHWRRRTHSSQKYSEATEGEQKEYAEKKAASIKLSKPRKASGRQKIKPQVNKVSHPSLDKWFKDKFGDK